MQGHSVVVRQSVTGSLETQKHRRSTGPPDRKSIHKKTTLGRGRDDKVITVTINVFYMLEITRKHERMRKSVGKLFLKSKGTFYRQKFNI